MITLADKEDKRFNIADTLKLQATMVPPPELKDKDMFDMKKKNVIVKNQKNLSRRRRSRCSSGGSFRFSRRCRCIGSICCPRCGWFWCSRWV